MTLWHFNKTLKSYVIQINTKSVAEYIIDNLGIKFNPRRYSKMTKDYIYFQYQNNEQQKQFNKDRVEFRSERHMKMILNPQNASVS